MSSSADIEDRSGRLSSPDAAQRPSSDPVFVVEADGAARNELVALLRSHGYRARGFATAGDFLQTRPDAATACVLTDAVLPDGDAVRLIHEVVERHDHVWPVIVVARALTAEGAVALIKAGAADVITRPFTPERVLEAVRLCLADLDRRNADRNEQRAAELRLTALTPRERQVFDGLIQGRSSKEIAQGLEISPRTVEVFRARVMEKMQAPHLPSLVRTAVRLGLPAPDGQT